jgi:hypothetical protein
MTHLHLASHRKEIEKPSDFDQACHILRDVLRKEWHANLLWQNGRWVNATVDDIMTAANVRRKQAGLPQFGGKLSWLQ